MTPAEMRFAVTGLGTFVWPITWRFHVETPFGRATSILSAECPGVEGSLESSQQLGEELWQRGLALASTVPCYLHAVDTVAWKLFPGAVPHTPLVTFGRQLGVTAPRTSSCCLVLHTGHPDDLARRQLILPGTPAAWSEDGLITSDGFGEIQTVAQGLFMGMTTEHLGGPLQLLNCYPDLLPATMDNPSGVAFRLVEYIRCCWHTVRAPEPTGEPWP